MPNRIIKESICVSESIDSLNWFEEVLFYRLIVNCDDFGRFDGRVPVVKNRLFPLKDNVTAKAVEGGINKLASIGLVRMYECDGKPYLYLPTWNDHQSVRAKRSKYPAPDDSVNAHEIICKQVQANVPVIQSESNSISESESNAKDVRKACEEAFEKFWSAYPRKEGKQKAKAAFEKVNVPLDVLLNAIEQQKESAQWSKDNGQFIPHPTTWLNGKRWEDEVPVTGKAQMGANGQLGTAEMAAIQRMLAESEDA
jgi:hypothetical protein